MKPKNIRNEGCNPISSDCVTYEGQSNCELLQGCYGESVTDVIERIDGAICTLNDILNAEGLEYDQECLGMECGIENIKDVLNILLKKFCEIKNNVTTGQSTTIDYTINVSSDNCFAIAGGTYNLVDFVHIIADKICNMNSSIGGIINTIDSLENAIQQLNNNTPTNEDVSRIINSTIRPINNNIQELGSGISTLNSNLGNTKSVHNAITTMPSSLSTANKLYGQGQMQDIHGWILTPNNTAESITDMWHTIIDMRNALSTLIGNLSEGCSYTEIIIDAHSTTSTRLVITLTGHIPAGYIDSQVGSSLLIRDRVTGMQQTINNIMLTTYLNGPNLEIDLSGVSGDNDLDIRLTSRIYNPTDNSECVMMFDGMSVSMTTCPTVTLVPNYTSIAFSFSYYGNMPSIYAIECYDSTGTNFVGSVSGTINGNNVTGTLYNLTENTTYKVRLVVNGRPCDFQTTSTLVHACSDAVLVSITTDLTNPEGDTNGNTI